MTDDADSPEDLRNAVRSRYAAIAQQDTAMVALPTVEGGCCGGADECCGSGRSCGSYSAEELAGLPPGADLGLGCGNPTGLASLQLGETALDLGSGAGVDCFLAGDRVGPTGHVIGVDMTPEMLARARTNARTAGRTNVEFRLGEVEHLPVADGSVDVVLSNCVINLAPDKEPVYREAFRVLRPGGRLVVSDVLATRPIPAALRADRDRWSSCSSGALTVAETREILRRAGFDSIEIALAPDRGLEPSLQEPAEIGVVPATVRATKPGER
jgi:arsenite methyltransferase